MGLTLKFTCVCVCLSDMLSVHYGVVSPSSSQPVFHGYSELLLYSQMSKSHITNITHDITVAPTHIDLHSHLTTSTHTHMHTLL